METDSLRKVMFLLLMLAIFPGALLADGPAVDKVYRPYVQPLERELEYRVSVLDDSDSARDGLQVHRLGLGASINDHLFAEFYAIGENSPADSFQVQAYEVELKWQLTEQGEYAADWGLLFELEKQRNRDAWEFSTAVLAAREFGRWVGIVNLSAIYEAGSDIDDEWESALAAQWRYRYSPRIEPALELYSSESTKGLGPVLLGDISFSPGRRLHWEAGLIAGIDADSPDATWRLLFEYEFY